MTAKAFNLQEATDILERTPSAVRAMIGGLSDEWLDSMYSEDSFSSRDVIGHLIEGERHDWIVRARIILEDGTKRSFDPFDRDSHREWMFSVSVVEMLDEFERLRGVNLRRLGSFELSAKDLDRKGIHPEFGEVTMRQLLATWVAHDLFHIAQIAKALAARYGPDVGPWSKYLGLIYD